MFIYIFSRIYCIPIFSLDDFNKYTENIELQNNISLRGLAKNQSRQFIGILEGNNHVLSDYVGFEPLFSHCFNCIIQNVVFSNFEINSDVHASIFNKTTNLTLINVTIINSQFTGSKSASSIAYWSSSIFQLQNVTIYDVKIKAPLEGGVFIYNMDNVQIYKSVIHSTMSMGPVIGFVAPSVNITQSELQLEIIASNSNTSANFVIVNNNQNNINIDTSIILMYCNNCQILRISNGQLNKTPTSNITNSLIQVLPSQTNGQQNQIVDIQGINLNYTAVILPSQIQQFQLHSGVNNTTCTTNLNEFKCSYIYGSMASTSQFTNQSCPISDTPMKINTIYNSTGICNQYSNTYIFQSEYGTPMPKTLIDRFKQVTQSQLFGNKLLVHRNSDLLTTKSSDTYVIVPNVASKPSSDTLNQLPLYNPSRIGNSSLFQQTNFQPCVTRAQCEAQCDPFFGGPSCICLYDYNETTNTCSNVLSTDIGHGNCILTSPQSFVCTSCATGFDLNPQNMQCYERSPGKQCPEFGNFSNTLRQSMCKCAEGQDWSRDCLECLYGYEKVSTQCVKSLRNLDGNCTSSNGFINCTCNEGFVTDNGVCREIYNSDSITLIVFAVLFSILAVAVITYFTIQFVKLNSRDKYLDYNPDTLPSDAAWQQRYEFERPLKFTDVTAELRQFQAQNFQI